MDLTLPSAPRFLSSALLLGVALGGCMTGKSSIGELEDASASASSSPTDGEAEGSGGEGSTTASPSDGGIESSTGAEPPPLSCPPTSQCSLPLECEPTGFETCGGRLDRNDENGCPRQPCDGPGQCPAGTSCVRPVDWARCGHHGCEDSEETGACECGFGLDCNDDGVCLPDEEGVPPDTNGSDFCGQHTDAGSCEGSLPAELGTCRWYEGWQMPAGAACEERVPVAQCVFTTAAVEGQELMACALDASLAPMVLDEDGQLTVLLVDPAAQPLIVHAEDYAWSPCDFAGTEAECECECP